MDAGCEDIEGYCSDITRCWMISGSETVSSSQSRSPGCSLRSSVWRFSFIWQIIWSHCFLINSPSLSLGGHGRCVTLINSVCVLGSIISSHVYPVRKGLDWISVWFQNRPQLLRQQKLRYKFCPHHVSHFLGLDVHWHTFDCKKHSLSGQECVSLLNPDFTFEKLMTSRKSLKELTQSRGWSNHWPTFRSIASFWRRNVPGDSLPLMIRDKICTSQTQ